MNLRPISVGFTVGAFLFGFSPVWAQSSTSQKLQGSQKNTVEHVLSEIHHVNQMQIQAGQLAEKKTDNPSVRQFAQRLVQDHQDADKQVTSYAQQHDLSLSWQDTSNAQDRKLRDEQHAEMARLEKANGADFNREFERTMAKGHEDTIRMLQQEQAKIQDQQVKQMISSLIPKLQEHQQMASALERGSRAADNPSAADNPQGGQYHGNAPQGTGSQYQGGQYPGTGQPGSQPETR